MKLKHTLMTRKIFNIFAFIATRKFIFFIRNFITKKNFKKTNEIRKYSYLIKKKGFLIIENFLDKKECKSIVDILESFYSTNKEMAWHDKSNSEYRFFGAEKINKKINNFYSNDLLINIGSFCTNTPLSNLMTMANKVKYNKNNLGSGGGWHRDDFNFQFKAILYLNDVSMDNGPFQLIKNSNGLINIIKDWVAARFNIKSTRIDDANVALLDKDRLKTITGKAGTLILVDTSLIHRGKPLTSGLRHAMTNYYYPHYKVNSMKNHFLPKLK
ncbi:phytanoyl-CoA dioxygenase family protein [Candidatus Pelagibacter sp.]|nr:phytanoyl-CoA dioxygenase family protein [Candidatus Pelagibacter sp.]